MAAGFATLLLGACASGETRTRCTPDDQDGVVGGRQTVLLNVSDTAFGVGGVDSGSLQPNVAVQNSSFVTLTLTNIGTKPHSLRLACIPSGLPAPCARTSCFPDEANVPEVLPGRSVTVMFATPAVEGAYAFVSDQPGDSETDEAGKASGLVGQFVLM